MNPWTVSCTGSCSAQRPRLTDRLDDAILLGYGLSGMAVLYAYRSDLISYRTVLPLVICGFALFLFMGLLDALANRPDVFLFMGISQEGSARTWENGSAVLRKA